MDDFEIELKNGFLDEAMQLLVDAEQCFLSLDSNPNDLPTLEKLFRIAHNIKGSSKAVGFDALGAFTHEFETFMLKCKSGQIPITPATVSIFLKCNDHIKNWLESLKADHAASLDNTSLIAEIKQFEAQPVEASPMEPEPEVAAAEPEEETIRAEDTQALVQAMAIETPDAPAPVPEVVAPVVAEATSMAVVPKPSEQKSTPKPPSGNASTADESIRVSLSRLEKLLNFVGELVILQTVLREQLNSGNGQYLKRTVQQIGKITKEVQDISMSLRMVPLKQTFQKMQRIVRDTSGVLNKKVELVLSGEDTEVDKTVLEALGDPLVHLIRNAVDHGIETPAERVEKGKSEMGYVSLAAYHQSGKLVIEIRDDGGGIPADKLRKKAIEKGILKPNQVISDQEAVHLIFHPGFSTKAQVTEVSGRGVGMDVVKTNIEQMSGEVLVETELGKGSVFKVILPLTLAIIDGMIVRVGDARFVIPLAHVHESLKADEKDLKNMSCVGEVLLLRGENLPVMRLSKILDKSNTKNSEQIAIVVRTQGTPFAAMVDDILGQHQVVIKKLGTELDKFKGYSGSAILGDGKPALILELGDLLPGTSVGKRGAA